MKRQHELSEVNCSTSVSVEGSEDIFTELLCISPWEYLGVHFHELCLGQLSIRTVLYEPCVPLLRMVVMIRMDMETVELYLYLPFTVAGVFRCVSISSFDLVTQSVSQTVRQSVTLSLPQPQIC